MKTIDNQRIKLLVSWLISEGYAANQEELGAKLGVANKTRVSQLVNGKVSNLEFVNKLIGLDLRINPDWILLNEGEMLRSEQKIENFSENNSGVSNVSGNGNRIKNEVTPPSTADVNLDKILNEMAEQRKAYTSTMDKLLAQIESQNRLIEKLMDK